MEFVFQEFRQTPDNATPPYLNYLTLLSEFSNKLLKPDKKAVWVLQATDNIWTLTFLKLFIFFPSLCILRLSYLQKLTAEHIIDLREECWQPLIYYRASLLAVAEMEDAVSYVSSDRRPCLHSRSPVSKQKPEGMTLRLSLQNERGLRHSLEK